MKKFKFPLSISGSEQELKALIPELEKLGYEWAASRRDDYNRYPLLWTSYGQGDGGLGFIANDMVKSSCIKLRADKPDLILALAASVDEDKFYEGEMVISKEGGYPIRKITKVEDLSLLVQGIPPINIQTYTYDFCRKATKDEIMNHFKGESIVADSEITKYELIKEYPNSSKLGTFIDRGKYYFTECSKYPEFWKPIYETRKKKITLRHKDGTFEVEVSKEGVYYAPDNAKFSIAELQSVVSFGTCDVRVLGSKAYRLNFPFVDIGCHKQILVEDIKMVIGVYKGL